jgi:ribose/xylose/arabinose/galactoside ABC-type transport system permease subunit
VVEETLIMKTLRHKQLVTGLVLTVFLFCLANYFLDLGIFGGYVRQSLTVSIVGLGITGLLWAPNAEQEREIKRNWQKFWKSPK